MSWNHNEAPLVPGPQFTYPGIVFGTAGFPLILKETHLRLVDRATWNLEARGSHVLKAGIGGAEEIPEVYGVMQAQPLEEGRGGECRFGALEVLRPAPRRAFRLPFGIWMALARASALPPDEELPQGLLGAGG